MLARADKLRLLQFLVVALAQEEGTPLLSGDTEYPIWTPLHAFDAGDTLLQLLQAHQWSVTFGLIHRGPESQH